jgi:hypothetical protein
LGTLVELDPLKSFLEHSEPEQPADSPALIAESQWSDTPAPQLQIHPDFPLLV